MTPKLRDGRVVMKWFIGFWEKTNVPIDPELEPLLQTSALPYSQMPVADARKLMLVSSQGLSVETELAEVLDLQAELPGRTLRLRHYRPQGDDGSVLVYFHGGGWVLGSVVTHDAYCQALAEASKVNVISVDYRLAPEHVYPAAADDAIEVTRWIQSHSGKLSIDPARVGVGGDSAGGNLAAVVCQHYRDEEIPLACQVLIYPIVDCDNETASYRENGEGYLLTKETMDWFWDVYCPEQGRRLELKASPLRSRDLRALPPALVLTAGYDPLRDEAEQYARRLADSGIDVELKRYDGMIHGFVRRLRELKAARRALLQVAQFVERKLRC